MKLSTRLFSRKHAKPELVGHGIVSIHAVQDSEEDSPTLTVKTNFDLTYSIDSDNAKALTLLSSCCSSLLLSPLGATKDEYTWCASCKEATPYTEALRNSFDMLSATPNCKLSSCEEEVSVVFERLAAVHVDPLEACLLNTPLATVTEQLLQTLTEGLLVHYSKHGQLHIEIAPAAWKKLRTFCSLELLTP